MKEEEISQYDFISSKFGINDMIKSLNDGVVKKYSGYLTLAGDTGYDSFNKDLIVFKDGVFAEVIEKGIDHKTIAWNKHMKNIRRTCKRLGCTPLELLKKDYIKELKN